MLNTFEDRIYKSDIKKMLTFKYFLRKASPVALLGMIFMTAWLCQMIWAIAMIPTEVFILK